ncbi:MAG: hypothetical protein EHM40_16830, partial [Chloroflexi bacterium]
MLSAISSFFASSEDKDPDFLRLTRNIMIFALIATVFSIVIVVLTANSRAMAITVFVLAVASVLELIALLLVLRGSPGMAKVVVPITLILAITVIALSTNTIHDISVIAYPVIIIIAIFLQGRRALVVTMPLAVAAVALLGILDKIGLSKSPIAYKTGWDDISIGMAMIVLSAVILNLLVGRLRIARAKAEANEHAQVEAN